MPITNPTNTTKIGSNPYFGDVAVEKKKDLSMENFMRLLTVQLSTQNPLEPMNDRDFFAQMAQLGQVQGIDTLNKSMEVQKAQSLMGKTVTATRPFTQGSFNDPLVTGTVTKLTYKDGSYKLGIREANGGIVEVAMDALQSVQPDSDLLNQQNLIGKKVSGLVNVTENGAPTQNFVEGQVTRIFSENNVNFARVKVADGKEFDMRISEIRSVAPGS
jgi:flagellar basal-body rod modification protein FlgD